MQALSSAGTSRGRGEGLPPAAPQGSLSRRSSVMTTITSTEGGGGAHRLDLLIEEQKSAVVSAQEGLKQSLAILTRATSKEEKESARMQVQSLLSRAEELILMMRVISEIREELGHVQREQALARKNHVNASSLYGRQQWLETRLEKLLLAKRRGRPGAKGQRPQLQRRLELKRKSFGTLSSIGSPVKSFSDSLGSFSDRDTISVRDSNFAPSTVGGAPIDTSPSDSSELEESEEESEAGEKRVEWNRGTPKTQSEDSDAWHSESEANWTLVEASGRNGRDITQSQVLSEGLEDVSYCYSENVVPQIPMPRRPSVTFSEPSSLVTSQRLQQQQQRQQKQQPLPSFQEQDEDRSRTELPVASSTSLQFPALGTGIIGEGTPISSADSASSISQEGDGFEPLRPAEVFGACSWNSLPLAISSSLVGRKSGSRGHKPDIEPKLPSHSQLENFNSEVEILRQLIHDAAHATVAGAPPLALTSRRSALGSRANRTRSTPLAEPLLPVVSNSKRRQSRTLSSAGVLPQLDDSEPSVVQNSRKIYGKEVAAFPRRAETWYSGKRTDKTYSPSTKDMLLQRRVSVHDLQSSQRLRLGTCRRNILRSRKSARSSTEVDVFDREMHKERCIEHLLSQTKSSLPVVRRDSIQALGLLPKVHQRAKDRLHKTLCNDEESSVRYQALRSLIQLGVCDDGVVQYITFFLSNGSPQLQSDLLQLLCRDDIVKFCTEKIPRDVSVVDSLAGLLSTLLTSGKEDVPLYAAFLLSHAHLERDACVERLKSFLQSHSPCHRSMVLKCLLRCWHCGEKEIINAAITQMAELRQWKLRKEAVESLQEVVDQLSQYRDSGGHMGSEGPRGHQSSGIVEILSRRLTNEPILAVRIAIGRTLKLLKADVKVESSFLSDLDSNNEITRINAVLALSAFELKTKKTVRHLLDCVELDPSMYLRVQVIRVFGEMDYYNQSVMKMLHRKSAGQDAIAKESESALKNLYRVHNLTS